MAEGKSRYLEGSGVSENGNEDAKRAPRKR